MCLQKIETISPVRVTLCNVQVTDTGDHLAVVPIVIFARASYSLIRYLARAFSGSHFVTPENAYTTLYPSFAFVPGITPLSMIPDTKCLSNFGRSSFFVLAMSLLHSWCSLQISCPSNVLQPARSQNRPAKVTRAEHSVNI